MSIMRSTLLLSATALAVLVVHPSESWAKKLKLGTTIVEGPITAIDTTNNIITVSNVPIAVGTADVHTSTKVGEALADWGSLPSGALPGVPGDGKSLIGAHAVVQGQSDTVTGAVTANDVFTDISENPVTGQVTSVPTSCTVTPSSISANTTAGQTPTAQTVTCTGSKAPLGGGAPGLVQIEGMTVEQLSANDQLMPGAPPTNNQGFIIDPSTILPMTGVIATAQGYYGTDKEVHYFNFFSATGAPVNSKIDEVAITKAICLLKDGTLTIVGGTHSAGFGTAAGGSVTLYAGNSTANKIQTVSVLDAGVTPTQGKFKYAGAGGSTTCPTQVIAQYNTVYSAPFDVTPR
jgi:hypothetical protein